MVSLMEEIKTHTPFLKRSKGFYILIHLYYCFSVITGFVRSIVFSIIGSYKSTALGKGYYLDNIRIYLRILFRTIKND